MKVGYSVVFIFCILTTPVFSQILVGPVGGVNYSWTSFNDKDLKNAYTVTPVLGFHVGGHLSFKVQKRFFLHTSILYSSKGRHLDGKLDTKLNSTARYNFIEMPISYTVDFKGKTKGNKEFKYFLGLGPNISYWLGGKGTLYNSDIEENNQPELAYDIVFEKLPADQADDEMNVPEPNRFQLGLNLIAGMVLEPAYKQRIMVSVRYELGHTFLAQSGGVFTDTYFEDPLRSSNQGFRITVAYLIDLKTEERKKGKSNIKKKKLH